MLVTYFCYLANNNNDVNSDGYREFAGGDGIDSIIVTVKCGIFFDECNIFL